MRALTFEEVNQVIASTQENYNTLPSYVSKEGVVVNCFELNAIEIESIIKNRRIWVHHLTGGAPLQPFNLFPIKEYFNNVRVVGNEIIETNDAQAESIIQSLAGEAPRVMELELLPGQNVRFGIDIHFDVPGEKHIYVGEVIEYNERTGYTKIEVKQLILKK